jgi:hypothetical protein
LKIKYQGDKTSALVSDVEGAIRITHNLGYQPLHVIYFEVDTGKWARVQNDYSVVIISSLYPYIEMSYGSDNYIDVVHLTTDNNFYFYLFADSM